MTPPNNADGVLQDVHWSTGLFGYFPTYLLGNLYASQFFTAAEKDLGLLENDISEGHFAPLKTWLNKHVHQQGQRFDGATLGAHVAGEPLKNDHLMVHLVTKYGEIYNL